ncbi:MAG: DUF86 domain-containing protein [Deltaproteobacteria bacterium]|nr:MAG: DUF86 domain-containing protein [Deltaproteobacteria bacterium]
MDRQVIDQKLESLRRALNRVRQACPDSAESLAADIDAQDIVTLNLTRAVQLAVDIASHVLAGREEPPPETMGAAFDRLCEAGILTEEIASRMKRAVGFRNLAVHQYEAIDWAIVHAICTQHLRDFEDFARAVTTQLEK